MDRHKAIDKIKKCLALARSANEHEAATALRQAQALMREHAVDGAEVLGVSEQAARATVARKPIEWEARLAQEIADAFGCDLIFGGANFYQKVGRWLFIGCDHWPEIASYAFEVLLRQVKRARSSYMSAKLRRYGRANKLRMADMYCLGWVRSATSMLQQFARGDERDAAIAAFMTLNYPHLDKFTARDRNQGGSAPAKASDAYGDGRRAGRDAKLHHGVGGDEQPKRIGSDA